MPAAERRAAVLADFARLFGPRAAAPDDYIERDWAASGGRRRPHVRGTPGGWTGEGRHLARPVGPIHWAGTETAGRWAGFMDGAVSSGESAAVAVAASL